MTSSLSSKQLLLGFLCASVTKMVTWLYSAEDGSPAWFLCFIPIALPSPQQIIPQEKQGDNAIGDRSW
jgi:hypothetical protein